MTALSQNNRLIQISTPLGKDAMIVSELSGDEFISDLFRFSVELYSDHHDVAQKDLLGKDVTLSLHSDKSKTPRYIHGYVNHLAMLDINDEGLRRYRIEVVPGLWFTTLAAKNRIFQKKSADKIIEEVLKEYSKIINFKLKTKGKFAEREYCVQFEETDFTFISRLLAEEGISYYFTHKDGEHELILVNDAQDFADSGADKADYDGGGVQPDIPSVHSWLRTYNYHTNAFEFRDYSENATSKDHKQNIKTKSPLNTVSGLTTQGYGAFHLQPEGDSGHTLADAMSKAFAQNSMEAVEGGFDVAQGTSNITALFAGGRFELEHPIASETGKYLVTHLSISAKDGNGEATVNSNHFACVPSDVLVRPRHDAFRRQIHAPQIATVKEVKATASDSSKDPMTQVKVTFPWNSEQNSCWVRVVQQFAGKGWGANFVPRVDQEVVISYINGDPDRPLVTGAVYNGSNDGPNFTSTQSGWKTMIKDSEFNELRFDDKKGSEEIYMEAGKDHNWLIHNDQTGTVENDQTLTVKNDQKLTVEQNRTATISKGNDALTVSKGNQTTKVDSGNHSLKVSKGTSTIDAMGAIKITSKTSIELKVGANSIKIDQTGVQIKGTMVKTKASAMGEVSAGGILTVKGGLTKIN
ncbi:type VI secretion system Vgr family protein [Thalassolituus sp.]|uniref:type VI secretion system Vgr family protein n=1 Tax=Thalassolituus sp. TaxID=2030822 RepID=UPI0035137401